MEPTEMNIHDSYKLAISCVSYVLNISLNKNYKDKNLFRVQPIWSYRYQYIYVLNFIIRLPILGYTFHLLLLILRYTFYFRLPVYRYQLLFRLPVFKHWFYFIFNHSESVSHRQKHIGKIHQPVRPCSLKIV